MLFSVYDNNIFPFFCELNVFSRENSNFKIILNIGPLQRMTRMTKRVSKACKVDKGDRVTLAEKFACKPEKGEWEISSKNSMALLGHHTTATVYLQGLNLWAKKLLKFLYTYKIIHGRANSNKQSQKICKNCSSIVCTKNRLTFWHITSRLFASFSFWICQPIL